VRNLGWLNFGTGHKQRKLSLLNPATVTEGINQLVEFLLDITRINAAFVEAMGKVEMVVPVLANNGEHVIYV
jgi:hypothetical protein